MAYFSLMQEVYFFLLVFSLAMLFGSNFRSEKSGTEEPWIVFVLVFALSVLVSFSQIGRHLYLLAGGFEASQSGYWHWLRFGIANVLESVLFDVPAIYEWKITEIRAVAFWSRTILFLFRTSLEFLVVTQVAREIKNARISSKGIARPQHKNYFGFIFSKLGWLIVLAIWGIPLSVGLGAIVNDGFSLQFAITTFKFGIPLVFGAWFAWENLRSIFAVPGAWNKLPGLTGLLFGLWLVRENWTVFRVFMGF